MDEKTCEALEGAIKKWKDIINGGIDHGTKNCPLCQVFNNDDFGEDLECEGCPVEQYTGQSGCAGTPYSEWSRLHKYGNLSVGYTAVTEDQLAAAKAELLFLEGLRDPNT